MITKTTLLSLAVAASTAAQTTTTATLLIPDWCVTQSQPSVTVLGSQSDLTTYSFSCTTDYSKISSAAAKASGLEESAKSKASALRASLGVPPEETDKPKPRGLLFNADSNEKRDSSYECYGWDAFDACIPWEITQGASYWAVKLSTTDVGGLYQTCTFGDGGVANGPATCTASGRLDPGIWGDGDGSHTETFAKTDIDEFYIRNTVPVTAGGGGIATGSGPASAATGTVSVSGAAATGGPNATAAGVSNAESTGLAAHLEIPTGAVAVVAGAGGILAAALAL